MLDFAQHNFSGHLFLSYQTQHMAQVSCPLSDRVLTGLPTLAGDIYNLFGSVLSIFSSLSFPTLTVYPY